MPFKKLPPLYTVWLSMRDRCRNPNNRAWKNYGGRGIRVCERWNVFAHFIADMGERPKGMRIERINNDGNYEPSNCCWATPKEQQRNRRGMRRVTIEGKSYLAVELAERSGLKTDTIVNRAAEGLTLRQVLSRKRRVYLPGLALGGFANGARQRAKTHCPHGHPYDTANTIHRPDGSRKCRACNK